MLRSDIPMKIVLRLWNNTHTPGRPGDVMMVESLKPASPARSLAAPSGVTRTSARWRGEDEQRAPMLRANGRTSSEARSARTTGPQPGVPAVATPAKRSEERLGRTATSLFRPSDRSGALAGPSPVQSGPTTRRIALGARGPSRSLVAVARRRSPATNRSGPGRIESSQSPPSVTPEEWGPLSAAQSRVGWSLPCGEPPLSRDSRQTRRLRADM